MTVPIYTVKVITAQDNLVLTVIEDNNYYSMFLAGTTMP